MVVWLIPRKASNKSILFLMCIYGKGLQNMVYMGWDVKIFPNIDNIANTKKPYLNIWTFLTISQYSPLLIISQFSQTNDNIHIMYIPVCALVWLDLQYVPFQFRGSTLFAGYTPSSQSQIRMKRTCLSFPDTHVEVRPCM